ncbi:ZYRO0B13200p [Zygosaccharomyces rouxii]|uniref:ZYRO0B13200p n=1 Tax=Zygosaccharomyces rouxii (strain ATCC 2623 / CBS 732 / NBRC 1130 / NCYC 568 / NRRL Y-229) TaxID=559307 RepID=C5DS22_ZYGRC|nr:uncharacterized protein ZYRO0B13200g [Zygosaccharomyces rouxii]KAH9199888.1 actin cortical patch SUR7/pH-response regulator pali [Zygosaccharomyces rouxii]CAR26583.1 ZYRO0B13200p [Zygosaccharomyces rouxii]
MAIINASVLFFTALLSFSALILAIVACAGSTSNYNPLNKIFVAQLNLKNLNADKVFSKTSSELDIPAFINVGLWSYCVASDNGSVKYCTSPNGIQKFDLKKMLTDSIGNNKVADMADSLAKVMLPDNLQDKMGYYNNLVKCMFITLLIGICALFLDLVVNIVRWIVHARLLNWFGRFLASIAFTSLIISAGTSTGTYVYIRHLLKENYDEYGIKLSLGRVFLALIWATVGAALFNSILWGLVRARRRSYPGSPMPSEEKPLI